MGDILTQVSIFGVLLAFLVVGFWFKKKPRDMKEYALGGGKISTSALIATMVATTIGGGSVIGLSSGLYQKGVWMLIALCGIPLSCCLMSIFVVPRLTKYYGCCSIAEVIGKMYGDSARKLVGIVGFVFCIGILGAQIKALHWVIEHVVTQNSLFVTLIALSIVVLYSMFGGVSSVIKTDVAQFVIFMVVMPIMAYYIVHAVGSVSNIVASIPEQKTTISSSGGIWGVASLFLLYLSPDTAPDSFHRLLVGQDCKKNQASLYMLAVVNILNTIFVGTIAFIALLKFPHITPKETIFAVISGVLPYKLVLCMFAVAMIAIITSTADSLINTGAIVLVNDVLSNDIKDGVRLKLTQIVTFVSGVVATVIALCFSSVLNIVLFFSEYCSIIIDVPLIAGLFLYKLRKEPFL